MEDGSKTEARTVVGLDVHKDTIVAAVLPPEADQVREAVTIEHTPPAVAKLASRLAPRGPLTFVYEAGPCGYELHRQLTALGHRGVVIAPALTPVRPGDRVKTDRRDAEKLAFLVRAGLLTEIRVPTREEEAARDLVRAREDALADRLTARNRLGKFLLRQGRRAPPTTAGGARHGDWRAVQEAQARLTALDVQLAALASHDAYRDRVAALRGLKGLDTLSALTLWVEIQDFRRFPTASAFMSFTGLVGSERSTGTAIRRGGITKAGNAHVRRVLVEAAWSQRHKPVTSRALTLRRAGAPATVLQIARQAQTRLHRKYWRLVGKGKAPGQVVVAVARELAGFVWAIAQHVPAPTGA
jgi:transposase